MRAEHLAEPPWDPALVRRLGRRALRPGVIDPGPAREILARHRGMMPDLPLVERVARHAAPEPGDATPPVVYGTPVPADVTAPAAGHPAEPLAAVVRAPAAYEVSTPPTYVVSAPAAYDVSTSPTYDVSAAVTYGGQGTAGSGATGGLPVVQRKLAAPAAAVSSPVRAARPLPVAVPRARARSHQGGAAGHARPFHERAGSPPVVTPIARDHAGGPPLVVPVAPGRAGGPRIASPLTPDPPGALPVVSPRVRRSPDGSLTSPAATRTDSLRSTAELPPLVFPARPVLRAGEPLPLAGPPARGTAPAGPRNGPPAPPPAATGRIVRPGTGRAAPARAEMAPMGTVPTGTAQRGTAPRDEGATAARVPVRPPSPAPVDIEQIVETVHRRFARRLAIEAERRGAR
ncbi:hypothetical protein GCM10022226_36890 [Sphaerisporangium flaviroseum]|uniref:Uncharacterized protein n=1 Tax=Sphaerisporangium flaviroseum TaxID=509199 RepID=A0ABP7I999_9ACTN